MKNGAVSMFGLRLPCLFILAMGLGWGLSFLMPQTLLAQDQASAASELEPTHEQTTVIQVADPENKSARLSSFCLDREGNLLAAVTSGVLRLNPEGELLNRFELGFAPEAICQTEDGTIFVGGAGKLAKLDAAGEVVSVREIPWLGDKAILRKEAKKAAKAQLEQLTKNSKLAITNVRKRIEELEAREEKSERDEQRLEAMQKQLKTMSTSLKSLKARYESPQFIEQSIARRSKIVSLAATDRDVFVSAAGSQFGFDIYRVDHSLENPKRVLENLGGCCGNCHINASQEHLMIAANTKFNVVLTDREGKEIRHFGERGGSLGFEGCCNPMNLSTTADGSILTAESGGGVIKRYSPDGELLAVIGKAKVAAGCKNVAIAYHAKLDRYFMQNISKSEICVLERISSPVSPQPESDNDSAGQN